MLRESYLDKEHELQEKEAALQAAQKGHEASPCVFASGDEPYMSESRESLRQDVKSELAEVPKAAEETNEGMAEQARLQHNALRGTSLEEVLPLPEALLQEPAVQEEMRALREQLRRKEAECASLRAELEKASAQGLQLATDTIRQPSGEASRAEEHGSGATFE